MDVGLLEVGADLVEAFGVAGDELVVHELFLEQNAEHRQQQPGVGAGLHLEEDVGQVRRLGAPDVDDDEAAFRVLRELAQRDAGSGDAVRLPRVLAEEDADLAVVEVAARVGADHLAGHPHLARLLLRERVGPEDRAQGTQGGTGVETGQMIPLASAAVVEDRLAAEPVANPGEPLGHLADRGVPVDLLEAAVRAPAQRREHAVTAVLVVVQTSGLLADVAFRDGVRAVASQPRELSPVVAAQLDLDAAVVLAQDARGRLPRGCLFRLSRLVACWLHGGS